MKIVKVVAAIIAQEGRIYRKLEPEDLKQHLKRMQISNVEHKKNSLLKRRHKHGKKSVEQDHK